MKKTMLFLAAISIAFAANAKILRVSNVSGSSAPYTSIEAAHDAASSGDTIMIDASPNSYGEITLSVNKQLVLIGPGYWLVENGIVSEGTSSASLKNLTIKCEGTVVKGLSTGTLVIDAPKVIINRCNTGSITLNADNCIISQNFIQGGISGGKSSSKSQYHQITNNILHHYASFAYYVIQYMDNSYIAYNTARGSYVSFKGVENSTIDNNIAAEYSSVSSTNSTSNNYETTYYRENLGVNSIDSDYLAVELPTEDQGKYGAFAGDSPYILSGVPSGPVIQDLVVPTTVEMGSKMNVTIKVGMIK